MASLTSFPVSSLATACTGPEVATGCFSAIASRGVDVTAGSCSDSESPGAARSTSLADSLTLFQVELAFSGEDFGVLLRLQHMANTIPPQTRSSRNTPPTTPPVIAPTDTGVLVELADGVTDTIVAQELKLRLAYKSQRGFDGALR
jgi:hypothetical protein